MCDPVTMGIIYVGTKVYEGYQQGEVLKDQADVKDYNARQLRKDANRVREVGVETEGMHREQVQQVKSNQRANMGASGVLVDSGTNADIIEDTEEMGVADALRIRKNYQTQAETIDAQAVLLNEQAMGDRKAANNAVLGGLIGGGTIAASQWYDSKSAGAN